MARNVVKRTDYFYEEEFDDNERYLVFFDTKDELFYELAKIYAFDDLDTGMRVTEIICEGMLCHYTGWQPDMVIEFAYNESGEVIWSGQFPQWDH